jgi:hypothetical protein
MSESVHVAVAVAVAVDVDVDVDDHVNVNVNVDDHVNVRVIAEPRLGQDAAGEAGAVGWDVELLLRDSGLDRRLRYG